MAVMAPKDSTSFILCRDQYLLVAAEFWQAATEKQTKKQNLQKFQV